ncbi:hypothetical protein S7711_00628 [Stachybotrys chartarum IBT 7711]|uniref:Uncharacterized protein n=1 Tax=Stachybotrys chartarum (strain CBS 109288 / IBT 7711) TaxID=1280523 RepID=A0A084ATX8_STACB|nr:hypothetical protein S7711_00628 [Stachybotrys chartarum IBT 7711]KFA48647.1 hypothetical protein S40293_04547 [Stachybotrys chartarum IBT 40293]KFA73787.1 hypothetical protein S40288_03175 [Stachybotrys chartarum IBT 40288]
MSRRAPKTGARCTGSSSFCPDDLASDTVLQDQTRQLLNNEDLYNASRVLLGLPENDDYTYYATAVVKLREVQRIVQAGGVNGLHSWYRNQDKSPRDPPPWPDVEAYTSIFSPTTSTVSLLKNFGTNAKKGSIRTEVAAHLDAKRYIHPALAAKLTVPKSKKAPYNPYYDFWAWSCRSLEWCGPCESSERIFMSHHVLPIFMHHFGCVTPSHESLQIIKTLAEGRALVDMGAGGGYWAWMLRCYGLTVHAVDNMQSEWRVQWLDDLVVADGVQWLRKNNHGKDLVLLMVYPVVGGGVGGGTEGSFTRTLVDAYQGDTIAVVGTQNGNGYTSFKGMTMDQYMEKEHQDWTKVVQIPLPSFAGKDEALYIFQRGPRVPTEGDKQTGT